MSEKNRDNKRRWRSISVSFRVSPQESDTINMMVLTSGLTKQDYCTKRLLCEDIVVQPNIRIQKYLRDYLVSLTEELKRLEQILAAIELSAPLRQEQPDFHRCRQVMSVRQAMLSPAKTVPVEDSLGKVLAAPSVGCPPAVPIVICGEQIDETALGLLQFYGVEYCTVVEE